MKSLSVAVIALAALLAVIWLLPTEWWWAKMTLISFGTGIFFERLEECLERVRVRLTGERDLLGGVRMSLMFWLLAFVFGIFFALLNGLGWWCIVVGILNAVIFAVAVAMSMRATTKPTLKSTSR